MRRALLSSITVFTLIVGALRAEAADIVQTAQAAGSFQTLIAAAKAAGLAGTLASTGPITVFAPTDAAFAALPGGTVETLLRPENKAQLAAILSYHVLGKAVTAHAVPTKRTRVETLDAGETLVVMRSRNGIRVNDARVVQADIRADNGVIHVIDRVLLPPATRH